MKRLKKLKNSLWKAIICSIVFGFLLAVVLSPVVLAFYIATCEDPTPVLEYLDSESEKSIIMSGY